MPVVEAQDDHFAGRRQMIFVIRKQSAQNRRNTQDVERVGRDELLHRIFGCRVDGRAGFDLYAVGGIEKRNPRGVAGRLAKLSEAWIAEDVAIRGWRWRSEREQPLRL